MTSTYRFAYFWNSACLHFTLDCTWRQSSIKATCTCIQTWNFYFKLFPRITTFHFIWLILTVTTKRRRRKKVAISYLIPQLSPCRSTNCTSTDTLSVSALGQAVRTAHSDIRAFHYIKVMEKPVISVNMICLDFYYSTLNSTSHRLMNSLFNFK